MEPWFLIALPRSLVVDVVAAGSGLVVTWMLGWGVRAALKQADISERSLTDTDDPAGALIGRMERIFFFATLWAREPAGVAAWLVFKLGMKWGAWQHIVKVGDAPDAETRRAWSRHVLNRASIGMLFNVLCGVGGVVFGRIVRRALTGP